MTGFNRVMLMGNVTRDPQLKYLPSQTPVTEFGLAVNRRFKSAQGEEREEVAFIEITAFGKQAETLHQYCHKGKPLFVEGRLKFDQWDDKESGQKRSKLSVILESFQFIGGKENSDAPSEKKKEEALWKEEALAKPMKSRARQPVGAGAGAGAKYKEEDIPF